ncbi:MAG: hypothetical protein ABW185_01985 [Sedimenticola sp.]
MPKTRSEIQRAYRERKKNEGPDFLAKERRRFKINYMRSADLTEVQRKKRNDETKKRLKKHRAKLREHIVQAGRSQAPQEQQKPVTDQSPSECRSRMIVRLHGIENSQLHNAKKKVYRQKLKSAETKISKMKIRYSSIKKKLKCMQTKIRRQYQSKHSLTPKSRATELLRRAGLRGKRVLNVKKQLIFGNAVLSELKETASSSDNLKKMVYRVVSGKIVDKYKCKTRLSKELLINRNKLSHVIKSGIDFAKKRRIRVIAKEKDTVIKFLEREDNSRMQPGKRDTTQDDGVKCQTLVLTDYLGNLHQKYCSENPESRISLATFCRIRPKYIQLTGHLTRSVCLCTKHQNFALKLQAMKQVGLVNTVNPDKFLKDENSIDKDKLPEKVVYTKWKRVTLENQKKKMKVVTEELERDDFCKLWDQELAIFKEHIRIMKTQFAETRNLKDKLPHHEVILHMDFAENYSCKSAQEIQSAYWNSSQVTLHPIVVYYKDTETDEIMHKSYVAVSDELSHCSSSVLAIMDKFFNDTIDLPGCGEIQYVHYLTDSPTSQYRNRFIFDSICEHDELYGCPATWNYYEAGHGKSVCDGLGGTVKRMADEAVNSGKAMIQDADDFFQWAITSSMSEVKFFYVPKSLCEEKASYLKSVTFPPVKGTFKVHSAKYQNNTFHSRDTSCYCDICLGGQCCDSWNTFSVHDQSQKTPATVVDNVTEQPATVPDTASDQQDTVVDSVPDPQPESCSSNSYKVPVIDDYVAVVYDDIWYVGKVIVIDDSDDELQISFMQCKKQLFQWPTQMDVVWVAPENVLCVVSPPVPTGRSKRMMKLSEEDYKKAESRHATWRECNDI